MTIEAQTYISLCRLTISKGGKGQMIMIQLPGSGILNMAEVSVYMFSTTTNGNSQY